MAETNSNEQVIMDNSDPTEEKVTVERQKKRGFRLSRGMTFTLGFVVIVFVIMGVGFFGYSRTIETSSLASTPMLDDTPGGSGQAQSPAYQKALESANDQNATQAIENGGTFLITPEGLMAPVDTPALENATPDFSVTSVAEQRPTITALPAPIVPRPAATPAPVETEQTTEVPAAVVQAPPPVENPYTARILSQMTQVATAWRPGQSTSQTLALKQDGQDKVQGQNAQSDAGAAAPSGAASEGAKEIIVAPGTILYGETLTTTSSDNAAPVVVEVTTGEHKGAKLIGSYQIAQGSERMVVQFNTMTLANGETVQTSAYAVDGRSAETAVASDVDQRYLQRYGPVFAAAFVGGFASSFSDNGATTTETIIPGFGTTKTVSGGTPLTLEKSLVAGLGSAATKITDDLVVQAPKGPLITLQAGWPVGILFVSPAAR